MTTPIVKMEFGSRVYGTTVPTSDTDYKGIFIPVANDIVMQRAPKHIKSSTAGDHVRNTADDIDDEMFSIQTFMELLRQGQTVALDMLFTPYSHYVGNASDVWYDLRAQRGALVHKGTNAFVGYTKAQAAKYGHKGERSRALRGVVDLLNSYNKHWTLGDYAPDLAVYVAKLNSKEVEIVNVPTPNGDGTMRDQPHLSVANKKASYTCTVDYARTMYQLALDKYGHRAILAEKNEGVDWKACMHAVRIAAEAKELLLTGHITFPRPERELLLKIRKAELPYSQVEELIEQGLADINDAQLKSTLPEKPNHALMERIVADAHWDAVRTHLRATQSSYTRSDDSHSS